MKHPSISSFTSMDAPAPGAPFRPARRSAAWSASCMLAAILWALGPVSLQAFPPFPAGAGDDGASSIAVFRIAVNPVFESLMDQDPNPAIFAPYPGYNYSTKRLTSPLLLQPGTTIGRSAPGTTPLGTVPVGTAGTLVGPGDYSAVPPQFLNPPAGTREVRTEVRNLDLVTAGQCFRDTTHGVPLVPPNLAMVKGGTGQGLALCPGLVQANQLGADFPAKSFFNVFVQVNLPMAGPFPGAILYNSDPLQVVANSITNFPPHVAYLHEESTAVALKFKTTNPGLWNQDDVFGYMVLAGHGVMMACESNSTVEITQFLDTVLGTDANPAVEAAVPVFPAAGVKAPTVCCGVKPTFAQVPAPNAYASFNGQIAAATCFPADPLTGAYNAASYSLVVEDLQNCNAPPGANYVAPAFHGPGNEWTGAKLGSVFGLCFDDRGNIYVTPTSCYNQDVYPSGPGVIYRVNALTGVSSVFATIPGTGIPALGNIKYDCSCSSNFYVSSMEDGKIYRINTAGTVLGGAWDHGANLPTATPPSAAILDPNTAGTFTPLGRRIWGLKPHNGRLYYAVWWEDLGRPSATAANEIWSIAIDCKTGRFIAGTQVREIVLPPNAGKTYSNPVSDISFGPSGTMLLAERSMYSDTGPSAHDSRLLEYTCVAGVWTLLNTSKYQVSSAPNPGSAAGGCDYDFSPGPCGRTWATADYIVVGAQYIYGLQGLPAAGGNVLSSINIDLDGNTSSTAVKTEIGDVELPCPPPKCLVVTDTSVDCISTNGTYLYKFCVTNQFNGPIQYITLLDLPAGVTVSQDVFAITPLQPGQGACLSVYITNSAGLSNLCFRFGAHTTNFIQCCAIEHCMELPKCCAYIYNEVVTAVPGMGGCFNYTFTVKNVTVPPTPIQYLILVPDPQNGCYTITPDILYLATPLLPGQSVTRTVKVCSATTPPCAQPFWFLLSIHDTNFNKCCSVRHCVQKTGIPTPVAFPSGFSGTAYPAGGVVRVPAIINTSVAQPRSVTLKSSPTRFWNSNDVVTIVDPTDGQHDDYFVLSNAVAGTYSLTLELIDTLDGVWISEPATILVYGQMTPPQPPGPFLFAPAAIVGGQVQFQLRTEPGVTCHVEYTESLSPANWQVFQTIVGDGTTVTVIDSITNAPHRFFRVRMP